MEVARDDLTERLLEGKRVGRVDFAGLLDSELDAGLVNLGEVANHLLSTVAYGQRRDVATLARDSAEQWMRAIIERYFNTPQGEREIQERAQWLAQEE